MNSFVSSFKDFSSTHRNCQNRGALVRCLNKNLTNQKASQDKKQVIKALHQTIPSPPSMPLPSAPILIEDGVVEITSQRKRGREEEEIEEPNKKRRQDQEINRSGRFCICTT
jgi:hypothetical protein